MSCSFISCREKMAVNIYFSVGLFSFRRRGSNPFLSPFPPRSAPSHQGSSFPKKSICLRILRSVLPGNEVAGEEVMQIFVKDRQTNGDFVSKIYDRFWRNDSFKFFDREINVVEEQIPQIDVLKGDEVEINEGFLKLTKTKEWVSNENSAPTNKRLVGKKWKDDSEKRKKVNLLKYEALKGELLLLTIGIGAACGVYCLISLSAEAAISYAAGVLFSCLYLQLLYHHTNNLSKESIPRIFVQKKVKKIGIRSEDLKNTLEKTLNGARIALSSPRLVLPATIYGLWALSDHYLNNIHFELVPALLGFFAYKAAALVQLYRDNEDLEMVFPENKESSEEQ